MPHKLLLADDSVTIQRVIELTFADEDVHVIAVGDGQQAIEKVESERPDIVLADVGMPERDGYHVAAFIKGSPHLAHIPVLLLTGAFEPVDEQRATSVGCDGILVKPFEPQMVIGKVKDLLARPRSSTPSGKVPVSFTPPFKVAPQEEAPRQPEDRDWPSFDEGSVDATAIALPPLQTTAGLSDQPGDGSETLDEYFERLDAAFASLGGQRPAEATPVSVEADPTPTRSLPEPSPPPPAPPAVVPAAAVSTHSAPAIHPASLAEAFTTLLAAERVHDRIVPVPAPAALLTDELIDQLARRVVERITDQVVREAVVAVAERLVRDEIERLKAVLDQPDAQ
jgi:CheY-like chemotaxis protein